MTHLKRPSLITGSRLLAEERLNLRAVPQELATVHTALERLWVSLDQLLARPPNMTWRLQVATAVAEIASNIVQYAYPISADSRPMHLGVFIYHDHTAIYFIDVGILAVLPQSIDSSTMADLSTIPDNGYGLDLARLCVDCLDYTRISNANCWQLTKWFD